MRVTFIYHSAFLVELDNMTLLFDYFRGALPPIRKTVPLVIFASHSHGDHFSPRIFSLSEAAEHVSFVLSDDIPDGEVPSALASRTVRIGPGRAVRGTAEDDASGASFSPAAGSGGGTGSRECAAPTEGSGDGPGQEERSGFGPDAAPENGAWRRLPDSPALPPALSVRTLYSNDLGVAFLIRDGGMSLYFAGDLNNWWWDGDAADRALETSYRHELKKIRGETFDAAFIPLDPRISGYWKGVEDFLQFASARYVFPMHFEDDPSIIRRMEARKEYGELPTKLVRIEKTGEEFTI